MARIPDDELEQLKKEISLVRLIQAQGLNLSPHGKDLKMHCPWHDDDTASLIITPHKNLWHCMGSCQTGGSVIDWVMKTNGISFRHAVELLRTEHPYAVVAERPSGRTTVKVGSIRKLDSPVNLDADDQALLNQVIDYYHDTLKQTPDALKYLEKRGLADPEVIDTFKLGFSNRTLGLRIPKKQWKAGGEMRGRLQKLGILRESGHEHFNGSLVIPIIDDGSNVHEVYGRKINDHLRAGTPMHMYLPGPHRGVFNIQAMMAHEEIILCESLIAALTFWCAGYKNVTASYGTAGFTKEIMQAFQHFGTQRVLIAYDRDEAGDGASARLSEQLAAVGIVTYRLKFPKGMDVNEYALKVTPATQSLGVIIRGASARLSEEPTDKQPAPANTAAAVRQYISPPLAADMPLASPEPVAPKPIDCEESDNEVILRFGGSGGRRYRIRGLAKNLSYDLLKINILVNREDAFFVDTFDLYTARSRASFIKQATTELSTTEDVIKKDLGRVLLKLEELQDKQIKNVTASDKETGVQINDAEHAEAMALLQDPNLLAQILADFEACGVVGEETNKLVGYLAATSRLMAKPLAVVIQSNSAAGKSSLLDAVLEMMPDESQVKSSAMTGQSLYYMGESDLKHKILAIAEEEGAQRASYSIKILQSEGEAAIHTVVKDADTGDLKTKTHKVQGPVMLLMTTTALELDEELMNRCVVLTVNETREQTRAIHALQRHAETIEGLLAQDDKQEILTRHHNAQRLLKPIRVANPFARQLTFIDDQTRTRRDHMKYLTLIRSVTLLHQYQRDIKTRTHKGEAEQYIETTVQDIEVANKLAHQILGRSLDELAPQTRRMLERLYEYVCEQADSSAQHHLIHFTRREIREHTGWSDAQVRRHIERLLDLEYLVLHRGGGANRTGRLHSYELLYDGEGQDGSLFFNGLVDVSILTSHDHDPLNENLDPQMTPGCPPNDPTMSSAKNGGESDTARASADQGHNVAQMALLGGKEKTASCRSDSAGAPAQCASTPSLSFLATK